MNLAVRNFLDKSFDRDVGKTDTALLEIQQFVDRTGDYGSPLVEAEISKMSPTIFFDYTVRSLLYCR